MTLQATPFTVSEEIDILSSFGCLSEDEESVDLILSSEEENLLDSEDDYLVCLDTDEEDLIGPSTSNQRGGKLPSDENKAEPFTIKKTEQQDAPRYGTTQTSYIVNFHQQFLADAQQSSDPDRILANGLDLMIRRIGIIQDLRACDRISITIRHPELGVDVRMPFVKFENMLSRLVLRAIDHVAQSKTKFSFDMGMTIKVTVVRDPNSVGAGRGRTTVKKSKTTREFLKNRRSLHLIENKDELCLGRAICTALFILQNNPDRNIRESFLKDRYEVQTDATLELYRNAGVHPSACLDGRATLDQFQAHLIDVAVLCVHSLIPGGGPSIVYKGSNATRLELPRIHLFCHEQHYDVINRIKGFYGVRYYCDQCDIAYNNQKTHPCSREYKCSKCLNPGNRCKKEDSANFGIACHTCDVWFPSQECYSRHLSTEVCKVTTLCKECNIPSRAGHECTKKDKTCKRCGEMLGGDHQCFIQVDTSAKQYDHEQTKYMYYDLETMVDQEGRHIPNLCVIHLACGLCGGDESSFLCKCCPWRNPDYAWCVPENCKREIVFEGPNTLSDFGDFLSKFIKPSRDSDEKRNKDKEDNTPDDILLVAHYAKGFDNQFVLRSLLDKLVVKPEVLMVGGKILDISIGHLKFRDSHNFIPTALKEFSETFQLQNGDKGFFPHLFNTTLNQGVKLVSLPPAMYYDPDSMSVEGRKTFMDWYGEHRSDPFDLHQQLLKYCIQDVSILRRGCTSFIKTFLELTTINPFYECLTLPMACMTTYRRLFMQPNTLAIVPPQGYENPQTLRSRIADEWLASLERVNGLNLEREKSFQCGNKCFKADGYDPISGVLYEFAGCFYHGCLKCFPRLRNRAIHYGSGTTMTERYERTMFRLATLRYHPDVSQIVLMWECDYKTVRDPQDNIPEGLKPLQPRDAFYGGRTNGIHLYKKCFSEEKIRYVDVCSLYPYVCKYGKFPVGHPSLVHNPPIENLFDFDGVVQCDILPPTDLFHPLLPYRTNQKLYFPLCKTCAEKNAQTECHHGDNERAWVGTFTSIELQKAVRDLGYTVRRIYNVWHYENMIQYNRHTKQEGLFSRYVDTFYQLKQEASGYPENCDTPEKRESFVRSVFDKEGVTLDCEKIAYNKGKRSIAKLILNSHWGKFGQSNDKRTTLFIEKPHQLYDLIFDESVIIHDLEIINESTLLASKSSISAQEIPHQASNPVIAAWVTAQARLKLYDALHLLGEKCLYFDTDSVIYLEDSDTPNFPLGDSLGEWTDEIAEGNWISEFVTCGPKNYAYKLNHKPKKTPQEVCKIRGFTLNSRTSVDLNFSALVKTASKHSTDEPVTINVQYPNQLKRGGFKRKLDVHTVDLCKQYRFSYNKRRIVSDPVTNEKTYTIPYGFKR